MVGFLSHYLIKYKGIIFFKKNLFYFFDNRTQPLPPPHKTLFSTVFSLLFGRSPYGVATLRASLRSVLRTLRPSRRLTQKMLHPEAKTQQKNILKKMGE
jgi:hypothetical protein